ncbi:MAG TPA: polyprenyl synthetase family protein [Methanomicrobia archaeon]|nr:polyprenyl synthetase family protein [Methanomicrobia archaeon]
MSQNHDLGDFGVETYTSLFEDAYKKNLAGRKPDTLYEPILDLLGRGGKRLRPALCLLACELVGGETERGLPTAICIEFFHNFSLVHDDIEDGSELRRGELALHLKYGLPVALNAGDGLYALCYEALKPNKELLGVERAWRIFEAVAGLCVVLAEGQAADLEFKQKMEKGEVEVSEAEVLEVLRKKTARLFAVSAECGAVAGGASYVTAAELGSAWDDIGIAFQIRDDILNLVGEEAKYGKRIAEDISEGKPSLLLVNCLKQCEARERAKIYACFQNYDKTKIKEVVALFRKYGSIDYSEAVAGRYLQSGINKIRKMNIKIKNKDKKGVKEKGVKEKMVALAEYFVRREK